MNTDPKTWEPRRVVALTLRAEARGDDVASTPEHEGMDAVASVIRNRCRIAQAYRLRHPTLEHVLYGDGTPASACLVPKQFSCWNAGDPNRAEMERVVAGEHSYDTAMLIVGRMVDGSLPDFSNGATHYMTLSLYQSDRCPSWARSMDVTATVLHHIFMRDRPTPLV